MPRPGPRLSARALHLPARESPTVRPEPAGLHVAALARCEHPVAIEQMFEYHAKMARHTERQGERRSRLDGAVAAIQGLLEALHEASGPELAELAGLLDDVGAAAGAARVAVVAEAVRRGEVSPGEAHAWVREQCPSLRQGGAGHVARVAVEVAAGGSSLTVGDPDPDGPVGIVWAAVRSGSLSPSNAVAVWREVERLVPLLNPEAVGTVTTALVGLAEQWGPAMMRGLRPRLVAAHGRQGALDDLHHRLAAAARLSSPFIESGDLTEYQLLMTPAQAAALEAAIGPLSAPSPNPETGERDLRPSGQRRVEALAQVCLRSSAGDADDTAAVAGSPAVLHVSVELSDLEARTGAGEVLGSTADGTLIAPDDLRRIACDAALVPYVLGTAGEVLDVGRAARLFTRAQRRLLWQRDRGCTYPGCTAPPSWARAHHVRHWADGGRSEPLNAALLCQRHHTVVHRRRLWAVVGAVPDQHGRSVVWDLAEGSYDRALANDRLAGVEPRGAPVRARLVAAATGPPREPELDLDRWWDEEEYDDPAWKEPAA